MKIIRIFRINHKPIFRFFRHKNSSALVLAIGRLRIRIFPGRKITQS